MIKNLSYWLKVLTLSEIFFRLLHLVFHTLHLEHEKMTIPPHAKICAEVCSSLPFFLLWLANQPQRIVNSTLTVLLCLAVSVACCYSGVVLRPLYYFSGLEKWLAEN